MPRVSKKRGNYTLVDYKQEKNKRLKSTKHRKTTSSATLIPSSNPSPIPIATDTVQINIQHTCTNPTHYVVTDPSNGIDMCTFCLSSFTLHETKSNISAIIRKTQNYKFVELAPSTAISLPKTTRSNRRSSSNSIITNQPKISSFLTSNTNNTSKQNLHQSSIITHLVNQSRCVVEDFMLLRESANVTILIPQIESYQPDAFRSLLCNNTEYNLVQFGPKSSTKYHLLPAIVKSNPYLTKLQFNLMQVTEVTSAFNATRNTGNGVTFKLNVDSTLDLGGNKLLSNNFEIRWVDVLNDRSNGVQVWTELECTRDFSSTFKSTFSNTKSHDSHAALLSYIYEEICCDSKAVFTLLARYYHEQSIANKHELDKLNKKSSKTITTLTNFNQNNYMKVHNEIESVFHNAIKECYGSFTEITSPILSRSEILCLISLYKEELNVHYHVIKQMFGFDKKN